MKLSFLILLCSVVLFSGCVNNKQATSPISPSAISSPYPTQSFVRPEIVKVSTITWKTYKDSENSFTVKYPPDLIVKKNTDPRGNSISFSTNLDTNKEILGKDFLSVYINSYKLPENTNLKDSIIQRSYYFQGEIQYSGLSSELQPFTLGKYSGYSAIEGFESTHFSVYIQKNTQVFHFELGCLDAGCSFKDNPYALNIFLNMLQTVEFTKYGTIW